MKTTWLGLVAQVGALALMTGTLGSIGCSTKSDITEDEFCATYAKRECDAVVMTCQKTDSAPCVAMRTTACKSFAASAKGGTRTFRPDGSDACFNAIAQTYAKSLIKAEDLAALDKTCAQVFAGSGKANDACTVDLDCQPSLICDHNRKLCGALRPISSGGNCGNPGEVCPDTEYCQPSTGFSICTKRQDKGAICSDAAPCLPTLRCEAGTCVDKVATSASCQSDDECQTGYCNPYPPAGASRTCALGLGFSLDSPSCNAYFGVTH
jgi:hypothetical protein